MGVVLEVGLVLVLVAVIARLFVRRPQRLSDEREAVTVRRVEAYMATIRREGGGSELAAMSDAELRDLLLSSARNLRIENDRRWLALMGASIVGLVAAILDGLRGFGIAVVVAAIVVYAFNEIIVRRSREPLIARGIDVERLRVE